MITVVTHTEKNDKTGAIETLISHGIDEEGRTIIMSQDRVEYAKYLTFDREIGEYVIYD